MEHENPYQSPQEDSATPPDSPDDNLIIRRQPTWRFWVLVAFSAPMVAALLVVFLSMLPDSQQPSQLIPGILITLCVAIAFCASCGLISIYWRAPSKRLTHPGAGAQSGFVIAAIWTLAFLAAPLAFMCTCTPATLVALATGGNEGSIVFGMLAGLGGLFFIGWLARGLWLDASGRPRIRQGDIQNTHSNEDPPSTHQVTNH